MTASHAMTEPAVSHDALAAQAHVSHLPLYAALVAITLLAYGPVWQNEFIDLDDVTYITENPMVIQGFTPASFRWAWTTNHAGYWQPLTWLSFQFDAHFFSRREFGEEPVLSPAAFHGQNLFWHTASVLLLFALWNALTGALWPSFWLAALFAVHPLHVESVAWATERKDVLSVFFGIVAIGAYLRFVQAPSAFRYLLVLAAYVVSLMAKPMLVTLPCVLLLLDYWPLRRWKWAPGVGQEGGASTALPRVSARRLILEKVPLFALAAVFSLVTVLAQKQIGAVSTFDDLPVSVRLTNAATSYLLYLQKTFWPIDLAVFYPYALEEQTALQGLLALSVLAMITVGALSQARQCPWLIVGWLWFVGTLFPVSGVLQSGDQALADRFAYFPHIGLFVAVVWTASEVVCRCGVPRLAARVAGALVIVALGAVTWQQVERWRDVPTIWQHVLQVTQKNYHAHESLGTACFQRGELGQARLHFEEATRLRPGSPQEELKLGMTLFALGEVDDAINHLETGLEKMPRNEFGWHNVGAAYLRQGRPDKAAAAFRKALAIQPDMSQDRARGRLGLAFLDLGERSQARQEFEAALRAHPRQPEALHGMGRLCTLERRLDQAVFFFEEALKAKENLTQVYSDYGLALARQGSWPEALRAQQAACKLQSAADESLKRFGGKVFLTHGVPDLVIFQCRLAQAWGQQGEPLQAQAEYEKALKLDPSWPARFAERALRLAGDPNPGKRDPETALEMAEQACAAYADPPAKLTQVREAVRSLSTK